MAEGPEAVLQFPAALAAAGARVFRSSPRKQPPQSPGLQLQFRPVRGILPETPRKKLTSPIMKTKKWVVEGPRTVQALIDFIRKFLRLLASEQLFIYIAPSPDQEVGTLYECSGSDGKLVLHYCKSQAWG